MSIRMARKAITTINGVRYVSVGLLMSRPDMARSTSVGLDATDVGQCPCKGTMGFLQSKGAKHAILKGSHAHSVDWTPQDWFSHFNEERDFLKPALIQIGRADLWNEIERQHIIFEDQLRRYGRLDMKMMSKHGELEDYATSLIPTVRKS